MNFKIGYERVSLFLKLRTEERDGTLWVKNPKKEALGFVTLDQRVILRKKKHAQRKVPNFTF